MKSTRPSPDPSLIDQASSNTERRLARSFAVQTASLAVRMDAPHFPSSPRDTRRHAESAEQRLSGLESLRHPLVQAVLDARELCERTAADPLAVDPDEVVLALGTAPVLSTPTFGQLLLSAAVKDLEELDDRLFEARSAAGSVS